MVYEHSDARDPTTLPTSIKILVAGGFGVGKTTLVGAVSEVVPLRTEEYLTNEGLGIDDLSGVDLKNTTTVAMDFGRITISGDLIIYLFGTPGQDRFWFVWDELRLGALGAVVLADTRRLENCFPTVDFFERRGTPFIVAVNCFDDANRFYRPDEVQLALNLDPHVPVLLCDARRRQSAKEVLVALVEHVIKQRQIN
jgi:signal recognition particle receptor subunit beta